METFDYTKIIWGIFFIAAFIFKLLVGNKSQSSTPVSQDEADEVESFDFEEYFGESKPSAVESSYDQREREMASRVAQRELIGRRVVATPKKVTPSKPTTQEESKSKSREFDLRKAVIMSEILTPKFKEE